ncbi:MAG TPA: hypothetical protein VJ483_04325 [Holophagaceae bacterium]|nr:hypothetical protein [Holophagaceae bacterium]
MRRSVLFILAAAAAFSTAQAKPAYVKKAKEMGFNFIENCQSCHVDKMPKKDAKGEPFSDVGKFLVAEKAKHKAEEVDLNWLKDYKK